MEKKGISKICSSVCLSDLLGGKGFYTNYIKRNDNITLSWFEFLIEFFSEYMSEHDEPKNRQSLIEIE